MRRTRVRVIFSTLVILTAITLIAGIYGQKLTGGSASAASAPASGLDCGCTKTGDYKEPAQGVKPTLQANGNSPHNVYKVTTQVIDSSQQIVQVTVTRNVSGNPVVLSIQLRGDSNWGFFTQDATDKRLVIQNMNNNQHTVMLYALEKVDPQTNQAQKLTEMSQHAASAVVRFSPAGKYLFYSSIIYLGDVPTNQLQFVDATTGADVYSTSIIPRSAPGTPDDTFGSASWGWGPDTRDRTFAVENVTAQNQTLFTVVNLEAQATVVSELQGAISGYWVFSPCGDVAAMVEQTAPTTLDVWLRSTLDGHSVATTSGITDFGPILTTTTTKHQIKHATIDQVIVTDDLAPNVAPQSCPVVVPTPVNDSFSKATTLSNSAGSWSGNSNGATKETGEPNHAGNAGGKSVWFTWTATSSGRAQFTTSGSTFDTLLAAYTGSAVGSLTPVASNANGKSSTINFPVASGTTYKIALDGVGGASGNYSLNYQLNIAPSNDKFSNASVIPSATASGSLFGATQNATKETGEPAHAGDAGGRSIWFSWVAPSSGYITLTTTGSDYDTLLAVYTGSAVSSLTPVASDHTGTSSTVSFPVLANDSYKIAVDGAGGAGGSAKLSWQFKQGPANDFFSHPTVISGDGATVTGTSLGASKEAGEPAHGGDAGSASVWYVYTATADGTLRVEASATNPSENLDMLLGVYTGTRVDQLTLVRGNDDAPNTKDSRVRFRMSAGRTYYIAVDSKKRVSDTGATLPQGGAFALTYTVGPPPPANDDFAGALPIASDATEFAGDNSGALAEEGEPAHSGYPAESSVWYSWTAPESGTSTVRVCSANSLYRVSVYTGQEVNNLDCVGCRSFALPESGLNRQDIEVTKGTTYYIAVDGGETEGAFNVTLTPPDPFVTKFDPVRIPLPSDATGLIPHAFNDSDAVVGISFHHTPNQQVLSNAFIYEGGQTTEIGEWEPNGINNLREVVGATWDTSDVKPHAVLWRDGQLTQLDFGSLDIWQSKAVAVNDRRPHAQIVGMMEFNDNGAFHRHAFLYEDGQVTDLGTLGGENSEATSINNAGQIVGVSDTAEGVQHAFLYEQGVMKDLGPIPDGAPYSLAHGLSSTGSVTGNGGEATPDPVRTAFLRTPDGALELLSGASCDGLEPGPGYGLAVNRNDIVVGATINHYFRSNAFLYHKGVLFNLDALVNQTAELPQDWGLTHGVAVNDRGQVLAYQGQEGFEFASGYLLRPTRQLKPAPTYALTGRVVNSAGIGLSGINVKLDGTKSATATTDASGEYRFESLPADGSYRATPALDSSVFSPASRSVNDLRQDQSLEDIVLAGAQPTPTPTPTPTPSVNLSITETASANPAEVGRIFTYNISVSNAGPDTATGVNVSDELPAGVTYSSAMPTQGDCALASGTLTCQLGSIAANGSASIALQVKPRQTGALTNTVSVKSSETDSDASNNSAVSNIDVIKTADLKVAHAASAESVFVGGQLTYTTLVTNLGPVNGASGVTLTDALPSGMTFVSATTSQGSLVTPPVGSNGIVTANLGTLAVGAQATVTVTAVAAQSGTVVGTATVSSNETDTNAANNTATQLTTVKDAALQKVLLVKQVLTGGCENTTGQVYLTGPAPSGGVNVPLSSNITGASVPTSVFVAAGQIVSPAFNVTTSTITAKQVGLITAGSGAGSVSRGITINVGSGSCQ